MKIEWLEAFQKTVETRSLTKASEFLHISQPALSKQIRNLEIELGTTLLMRSSVGVSLTPAGQILFNRSKNIINEVNAMKREIILSQEKEEAFLTIGSWPSVATVYLPYHIAQNKRLKNKSKIKIKVSYSFFDLLTNLENRNIDAAVFDDSDVNHKFYSSPLFEEEFLLFVNRQHPKYGQKEEVSFEEIIGETFVVLAEGCDARMLVEKAFLEKGEALNIALEIELGQSILGFIEANLGISILPEIFINQLSDNIKAIPITNFKITRKISVIAREESVSKQLISLFKRS